MSYTNAPSEAHKYQYGLLYRRSKADYQFITSINQIKTIASLSEQKRFQAKSTSQGGSKSIKGRISSKSSCHLKENGSRQSPSIFA